MPNWTDCQIKITGTPERLKALAEAAENGKFFQAVKDTGEWDYDTYIRTYGTKWEPDFGAIDYENGQLDLMCNTAWSPPIDALNLLMEEDEIDEIECYYAEPGMDYCGVYYNGHDQEECISDIAKAYHENGSVPIDEDLLDFVMSYIEYHIEMLEEEEE